MPSMFGFPLVQSLFCDPQDCYRILNVSKSATVTEIRKSFKKLYRPLYAQNILEETPLNERASIEAQMDKLTIANKILTNSTTRSLYDLYTSNPMAAIEIINGAEYRYPSKLNLGVLACLVIITATFIQYTIRCNGMQVWISEIKQTVQYMTALEKATKLKLKKKAVLSPQVEEELGKEVLRQFPYDAVNYEFSWKKLTIFSLFYYFFDSPVEPENFEADFIRHDVFSFDELTDEEKRVYVQKMRWNDHLTNTKPH